MKTRIALKVGANQTQIDLFTKEDNFDAEAAQFQLIELDKFHFISDWYHVAILELTCTENFDSSPESIGYRLGITHEEATEAIDRLLRLGLLRSRNGKVEKVEKNMSNFSPGQSTDAHKFYQKQVMQMGMEAIDRCPQELKDITSMSMAIDVKKLPQARKMIHEFRKKMCAFLEKDRQVEVYNLSVQLFPISKVKVER